MRPKVLPSCSIAAMLQAVTDANIFVFALNLEYMEADFYSWASTVSDPNPDLCANLNNATPAVPYTNPNSNPVTIYRIYLPTFQHHKPMERSTQHRCPSSRRGAF